MTDARSRWPGPFAFFAAVAVSSVALNGYLLWKLYDPHFSALMASLRQPAPVTAQDHVRGPADAKVTLVEYGDFQCPYCRQLHAELLELQPQLHFRWVYRHYPLTMHEHAEPLAEASECAAEQGKFWEFADAVFAKPPPSAEAAQLVAWAGPLGIKAEAFDLCLAQGGGRGKVAAQLQEGKYILVEGTPTFFINGKRHQGALPLPDLTKLIADAGG